MITIGKLENGKVVKEYYGQGFIYKNFDAYENKTQEICYIPEHSGDDDEPLEKHTTYTYEDFQRLAKTFINDNPEVADWLNKSGYTYELIANQLFLDVDWQCPDTLIADWEIHEAFTE